MKIAIIGYGKMGRAIEKQALAKGHEIVFRVSRENASTLSEESIREADVAMEFSRPETAVGNVTFCLKHHVPVVSGTTGWLEHWGEIVSLCTAHQGAFFYASNFSIGVNITFALNRYLSRLMNGRDEYEVSIEEIHHTQKLDYPSGTAITLAQGIIENVDQKDAWNSSLANAPAAGNVGSTSPNALHILSKRIAQTPGTHHVKWSSLIDEITVSHVAHSREGFATGALAAAEWLVGKVGVFGMKDMMGF